ncbi:MAG: alpha-L-fucosidase, partial [Alistipes sp.]|nr:alpha-L-fucosidase [Alistipes sp.]
MKKLFLSIVSLLAVVASASAQGYVPSEENIKSREAFADDRFGIFIHWGIYSMFAQGEWYLQNAGLDRDEYAKAADAFYPHRFDAKEWVSAIKASGAKYVCFTTRHHDSFSMWDTAESEYNIVDATPFKRDVLKELAEECQKQGIA